VGIVMKKIAIVTYSLEIGGAERVLFNLAKYLISKGNEVEIIETLKQGQWKNYFLENNIHVTTFQVDTLRSTTHHVKWLSKFLRTYDVIFLNDAPYAQSIIGLLPPETLVFPILHMAMDSMIKNAVANQMQWNKLVIVSQHLVDEIIKINPSIPIDDIILIPNGIEISSVYKPLNRFNEREGYKFVYLGRIEHEQKGVLFIPEIIEILLPKIKVTEVNIYGDGPSISDLKELIVRKNLGSIVHCRGPLQHEQVEDVFYKHDFLLMPSYYEGHPITLLEGMAAGLVSFVSNLPGRTDTVITEGVNGFLCQPGNPVSFAKAILNAINSKGLERVSLNARRTIEQKFTTDIMGEAYYHLINNEFDSGKKNPRNNIIEKSILGNWPSLPIGLITPRRKISTGINKIKKTFHKN
jgi:glycosyltransferase involved in cell wall biosynthesis